MAGALAWSVLCRTLVTPKPNQAGALAPHGRYWSGRLRPSPSADPDTEAGGGQSLLKPPSPRDHFQVAEPGPEQMPAMALGLPLCHGPRSLSGGTWGPVLWGGSSGCGHTRGLWI